MIIGVMASGDEACAKKHETLAKEVGSTIAELGFHLLTGRRRVDEGCRASISRKKARTLEANKPVGNLISILGAKELPQLNSKGKREWESRADNKLGEIIIRTHLPLSGEEGLDPLSRNHINALTSDLVAVLPGGNGTLSELQLAWEYGKKIIIYLGKGQVGGKTSQELVKEFSGLKVANTTQEFEKRLTE